MHIIQIEGECPPIKYCPLPDMRLTNVQDHKYCPLPDMRLTNVQDSNVYDALSKGRASLFYAGGHFYAARIALLSI